MALFNSFFRLSKYDAAYLLEILLNFFVLDDPFIECVKQNCKCQRVGMQNFSFIAYKYFHELTSSGQADFITAIHLFFLCIHKISHVFPYFMRYFVLNKKIQTRKKHDFP